MIKYFLKDEVLNLLFFLCTLDGMLGPCKQNSGAKIIASAMHHNSAVLDSSSIQQHDIIDSRSLNIII